MKAAKQRYLWFKHYHRCYECGRIATWHYSPGDDEIPEHRNYCEVCVSRGCNCQIDPDTKSPSLDKRGRELPCCEYNHYPDGYPLVSKVRSSFRKKSVREELKWLNGPQRFDQRRWRGELRRELKKAAA